MNFRTEIEQITTSVKIDYASNLFLIGSCFTDNIGDFLKSYKFNALTNPFGVLYNPVSVSKSLKNIINNKKYIEQDLILNNDTWVSLDHHGSFSNSDKNTCLNNINSAVAKSNEFLKKADTIFITLGTAWVFEHIELKKTVANCHKISAKKFKRRLLSIEEIETELENLFQEINNFNNKVNIVITISPIRHIKDGLHQNQISKSTLLLATNILVDKFNNVSYFPSYEIVLDDLRDYRFFTDDLVHLSEMAKQYVWNKFAETYVDKANLDLMHKIYKIRKASLHRPFNTESKQHQEFVKAQIKYIEQILKDNSAINFTQEIDKFNSQLV